ncbi:hypothetical protein BX265_6746 [Streptomyces sp. TLI_235]|nr:hypothetical protein BX265_6746 [Streptomyces sp. TLI_235]
MYEFGESTPAGPRGAGYSIPAAGSARRPAPFQPQCARPGAGAPWRAGPAAIDRIVRNVPITPLTCASIGH